MVELREAVCVRDVEALLETEMVENWEAEDADVTDAIAEDEAEAEPLPLPLPVTDRVLLGDAICDSVAEAVPEIEVAADCEIVLV